jgi:hypothetical protein
MIYWKGNNTWVFTIEMSALPTYLDPFEALHGCQVNYICSYMYQVFPGGWGFPFWAAAALMRALRLGE